MARPCGAKALAQAFRGGGLAVQIMESVSAAVMAKKLNGMLASVKAGVEIQAPSTA